MVNGTMMQYFHWDLPNGGTLWTELAANAAALGQAGVTALWLPPPYKAQAQDDVGYGAYDLWDMGEFDQKGTVRTKYGTRAQLEAAITAAHSADMQVYLDTIFNHKGGADGTERTTGTPVDRDNRNVDIGPSREIEVWTLFTFPGRAGRYSSMQWHWSHFDAVDYDQITKQAGTIYRLKDKHFETEVSQEFGNFDYLAFADIESTNAEVRADLFAWGKWVVSTFNIDGFRFDAAKHVRYGLFSDFLDTVRGAYPERNLFAVGEHFTGDPQTLNQWLDQTGRRLSLFDFPLMFNLRAAADGGGNYDMRTILNNTLVQRSPVQTVTFVENHDTYREHPIQDWFKPLAYALILLREAGYPCLFYPDYYGASGRQSLRSVLDQLLAVRRDHAYGEQRDYLDDANVIGWTRLGDAEHSRAIAVVLSDGTGGSKTMYVNRPGARFRDALGNVADTVTVGADGNGQFRCNGGSASVWVQEPA